MMLKAAIALCVSLFALPKRDSGVLYISPPLLLVSHIHNGKLPTMMSNVAIAFCVSLFVLAANGETILDDMEGLKAEDRQSVIAKTRSIRSNIDTAANDFISRTYEELNAVMTEVLKNDNWIVTGIPDEILPCVQKRDDSLNSAHIATQVNTSDCAAARVKWVTEYIDAIDANITAVNESFKKARVDLKTCYDSTRGSGWPCAQTIPEKANEYSNMMTNVITTHLPTLEPMADSIQSVFDTCAELYNRNTFITLLTPIIKEANTCIDDSIIPC